MSTVYVPEGVTKHRVTVLNNRVKRGAALLDKEAPSWWRRVKQSELKMSSPTECILGQSWMKRNGFEPADEWEDNGFFRGQHALFGGSVTSTEKHGFDTDVGLDEDLEYSVLADLWIAEIRERRRASHAKVAAA